MIHLLLIGVGGPEKGCFVVTCSAGVFDGLVIDEFLLICGGSLVIIEFLLFRLLLLMVLVNGLVICFTVVQFVCHNWVCLLGMSLGCCMAKLTWLVSKLMMHEHD